MLKTILSLIILTISSINVYAEQQDKIKTTNLSAKIDMKDNNVKIKKNVTKHNEIKYVTEGKLDEIIASGYAMVPYIDKNKSYFCFWKISDMTFFEPVNCFEVIAEFDKETNRPKSVKYIRGVVG